MLLKLRRITTSQTYIPEVDGLRFLAVLLVVVHHLWWESLPSDPALQSGLPVWTRGLLSGSTGVDLFFVLSGFILSVPFLRATRNGEGVSLRAFYLRRVTRLEPTYILAMTLWLAVKVFYKHWPPGESFGHYVASIFYVHYFAFGTPSTLQPAAWSLEIEIQFYLLMPFLAAVFGRPRLSERLAIYGAMVAIPTITLLLVDPPLVNVLSHTLAGKLQFFTMGMLVADLHASLPQQNERHRACWDFGSLVGLAAVILVGSFFDQLYALLPLAIGGFTLSVLHGDRVKRVFANPYLATLGGMCYTIYLFHNLIIEVIYERFLSRLTFVPQLLPDLLLKVGLSTGLIFILCVPIFAFVERPFMNPRWVGNLRRWLHL